MPPSRTLRLIAAGTIGNVLEWYDFAIYGYFAISIGRTFYPERDPVAQVLAAFGIFAVGYLMRPLGGLVTGMIGDRYGRRTALSVSVTAMAVPTFLVGVLPGYETLGVAAPILLTLLRTIQGLSVGGECTTSFTFMIENVEPHRRGLTGAIATASTTFGMLLGSGAGAIMAILLTPAELQAWGWRVPFLFGLLVGMVGYLLRRAIHEMKLPHRQGSPIAETWRKHKLLLVRIAALTAFGALGFYLMFLYIVSWLQLIDGVAPAQALGINTASMACLMPVMLTAGWLSDRIGRKPPFAAALVLGLLGAVPFLWLMHHPEPLHILVGQLGFVLAAGTAMALLPSMLVEATPAPVRCTAIALGFNVTYGVLGGLAPLFATWLVHRTGLDLSPAYLVMAGAAISLAALATFKETSPARTGGP